jgi:hypothetical protein
MTFAKRFIACSVCTVDLASTIGCNAVQRDYRTLYARTACLSTGNGIFMDLFFNRCLGLNGEHIVFAVLI